MSSEESIRGDVLAEGKYLRLLDANGWEFAQRINITGIVGMLAYTRQDEVVLVEQFRPPLASRVIEIPAGLVGDLSENRDEPMLEAARRELLEETGYQADTWDLLGESVAVSAGTTSETISLYRATDLRKVHDGGGDDSEDIDVHVVALERLQEWLDRQKRRGDVLIDVKVYLVPTFAPKARQ
jgi:ADP-ribose pyrophosphatase